MSQGNVPFLLKGAPAKTDTWADRFVWRLSRYFRRRRFSRFDRFLSGTESIVDFGGTLEIWLSVGRRNVVRFNIDGQPAPTGFAVMKGDARKTAFPDKSFDLAFSNSTIQVRDFERFSISSPLAELLQDAAIIPRLHHTKRTLPVISTRADSVMDPFDVHLAGDLIIVSSSWMSSTARR